MARTHERRPYAGRRPSAYPPTGCPTRRPSPARWCSYAYCRSLHITSFRSREPYLMGPWSARPGRLGDRRVRPRRFQVGSAPWLPSISSASSRIGSSPTGAPDGVATGTSGVSPTSWIQRLSGVSQRAIGELERAGLAGQLLPLLDRALAERLLADERRPLRVLERAGDDLAGRRAAAVDQADDPSGSGRWRRRRPRRSVGGLGAVGVLLPEHDARPDELAGHRRGRP